MAQNSGQAQFYLIEELAQPAFPHDEARNQVSDDMGVRYHKMLDKIRDAWIFAGAHYENTNALSDLVALEPEMIAQVGRVKSLREVSSRKKMTAIRDIWKDFCDFHGEAMKKLYGFNDWKW